MIEQGYRGTWNPFINQNHYAEIETCVEEVCLYSYFFLLIGLFRTIIIIHFCSEILYRVLKAVPHPIMVINPTDLFAPYCAEGYAELPSMSFRPAFFGGRKCCSFPAHFSDVPAQSKKIPKILD